MGRLTKDAVAEIRSSDAPAKKLAERYDVTARAIYDVRSGFTHRDGKPMPPRREGTGRPPKADRDGRRGRSKTSRPKAPRVTRWSNERWISETLARTVEEDRGYRSPCRIWQGPLDPVTRYATTNRDGKCSTRHRLMFEYVHGVTLARDVVVDHLCNQRACVNVEHLNPTTQANNIQRSRSKLTVEDVRFIRLSGLGTRQLAKMFGMQQTSIYKVLVGLRWANVV